MKGEGEGGAGRVLYKYPKMSWTKWTQVANTFDDVATQRICHVYLYKNIIIVVLVIFVCFFLLFGRIITCLGEKKKLSIRNDVAL